ncbi:MAG: cytochrome C oxidase subunit IV family protein [Cytophagales bacterium]|nr:cytochrome C oxidase subunit IV family protein [Cytophagales bacterium]
MSHSSEGHAAGQYVPDTDPASVAHRKLIWKTFWILFAITSFEFLIAFTKGPLGLPSLLVIVVFVSLTLVKAGYIVAEFMHLRYEVKALIFTILVPIIFVIWLIVALLDEGHAILPKWFN